MRRLFVLALLVFTLIPITAHAQSEIRFSSVSVDILPEYDQPAVLVIYHLELASTTSLPATIHLKIPAAADVYAVAVVDPVKGLLNAAYDLVIQGDWKVLTIIADLAQVQVEYYEALVKSGTSRHIAFKWAGDYPVTKLQVNFLQPAGSENVKINPAPAQTITGQGNLLESQVEVANLATGQPYTLTIDYQRSRDDLAITTPPTQATPSLETGSSGRTSPLDTLPWVLAGIGVVLITAAVIGIFAWLRGGKRRSVGRQHKRPRKAQDERPVYCHQCGEIAQPDDTFCRACGTMLRQEN